MGSKVGPFVEGLDPFRAWGWIFRRMTGSVISGMDFVIAGDLNASPQGIRHRTVFLLR